MFAEHPDHCYTDLLLVNLQVGCSKQRPVFVVIRRFGSLVKFIIAVSVSLVVVFKYHHCVGNWTVAYNKFW